METPIADKTPEDIDYVVVRENVGDVYCGAGGVSMQGTKHEVATQTMIYSRFQVERCIRFAFEEVRRRHTKENPWRGLSEEDKEKGKWRPSSKGHWYAIYAKHIQT